MRFEAHEENGIIIASVEGEIRISTQEEFKSFMDGIYRDYGSRTVLLDLSEVSYINSAGIGIIVDTFQCFRNSNGKMALSGLSQNINKLFEVTKLNRFIEIYTTSEDALQVL